MLSLTKKQIIILSILAIFLISFIIYYIYQRNTASDVDLVGNILENETEETVSEDTETQEEEVSTILIHVTGCVTSPGLVTLEEGSRIADAIQKSGGATENADLSQVNLAYTLEDGQKIYIPSYEDTKQKEQPLEVLSEDAGDNVIVEDMESTSSTSKTGKVNINTASQTELETIPGVGPSTALKIITYRKENGPFSSIEDIQNVKGIGEAKYAEMKDSICIK